MNTNELNIKILMADRCTKAEALKFLKTGTTIYDDIENYVAERNSVAYDEDEKITCDQIRAGEVADIGYVELDGIGYVIEYVN